MINHIRDYKLMTPLGRPPSAEEILKELPIAQPKGSVGSGTSAEEMPQKRLSDTLFGPWAQT